MKKSASWLLAVMVISIGAFVHSSCNKKSDSELHPLYLKALLARHDLKHDLYYELSLRDRSIEVILSEELCEACAEGNILFRDVNGELTELVNLYQTADRLLLVFKPEFNLKPAWRYEVVLTEGIRSVNGHGLKGETILECRTGSDHGQQPQTGQNAAPAHRNAIAIISDIHMGDQRAYDNGYCWFGKNRDALESFLDYVLSDSSTIKQLVILGDLFDEWLVPYTISPFDSSVNIVSTDDFFHAVADADINKNIFDRLKDVVNHDSVELVYVPGNHDMLGTEDILHKIIPGASWEGGPDGLGVYNPVPNMVFEHGHRYDFFNCPQPEVNLGHMLPPGYFVSRLYAKGMMDTRSTDKSVGLGSGSFEFDAAWDIAFIYTISHFWMVPPDPFEKNILMGGIDGYSGKRSFHETKEMYAANIETNWSATQHDNNVPVPMPCCLSAIWNGHSDLYFAAEMQYMQTSAPETYKVIAFGHTHEPMLKVYPEGDSYTSIYANSGTWIDADQSSHRVRTYLVITPKEWTGSEIDVVGLYQYNPDGASEFKPQKIAEESI